MGMLFDLSDLKWIFNLPTMSVLHVGAHEGEESQYYEALGWRPVTWVEAQPELVAKLQTRLNLEVNTIIHAAVWDQSGVKLNFNISSNSQSSSLLNFGTHASDYPDIQYVDTVEVLTKRLDEILPLEFDYEFINLDLQGVEGRALVGLGSHLAKSNYVYTEVNKREVYVGCSLIEELDEIMAVNGFSRVATRWVPFRGWGDAFYVKRSKLTLTKRQKFALIKIQMGYYISRYAKAMVAGVYHRLKG
jgi:FkbM family methyltransferase